MSERGFECSFPLISFADPDKVVSMEQVQFGEDIGSMERGKSRADKRQWILVFGDVI